MNGDRMHLMFNFQVNQHLFYALASADSRPLAKSLVATKPRPATAQWGLFLRDHDELDLGRLPKPRRDVVFKVFGPHKTCSSTIEASGPGSRDPRRLELAYSLMCALPGTPVIRYGDEIGIGDNLGLPERNCAARRCNGRANRMPDSRKATSHTRLSRTMAPMDTSTSMSPSSAATPIQC